MCTYWLIQVRTYWPHPSTHILTHTSTHILTHTSTHILTNTVRTYWLIQVRTYWPHPSTPILTDISTHILTHSFFSNWLVLSTTDSVHYINIKIIDVYFCKSANWIDDFIPLIRQTMANSNNVSYRHTWLITAIWDTISPFWTLSSFLLFSWSILCLLIWKFIYRFNYM